MPWLIVLDPKFWYGVAVALLVEFGDVILAGILLVLCVSGFLFTLYKFIMAKGKQ